MVIPGMLTVETWRYRKKSVMCDYCCILRANMRVNSHVFSKVEQDLAKVLWVSHLWHLLHGDGVHVEFDILIFDASLTRYGTQNVH